MIIQNLTLVKELYKKQSYLTAAGLFYGFPICCIKDYIQKPLSSKSNISNLQLSVTGYVPCENCIQLVENDWEKVIEGINQRRICKDAFPNNHNHKKTYRFFIELTLQLGFDVEKEISLLSDSSDLQKLYLAYKRKQALICKE